MDDLQLRFWDFKEIQKQIVRFLSVQKYHNGDIAKFKITP